MDSKRLSILVYAVLVAFGVVVVFAAIAMFTKGSSNNSGDDPADRPYVPNEVSTDNFTYAFLKLETSNQNLIYSPLSIKYALSMLKDGAGGKTLEELNNLIGDLSLTKYQNIEKILSVANSVFIRDSYKNYVLDSYINRLKEGYDAEVIYDSFKNADTVNNWIENKTFGIIKKMLSDSYFKNDDLEMILVNALAIDMEWLEQFEAKDTRGTTFTKENGEEVQAAMMSQTTRSSEFKYYKDDDYSVVSMPLKNYSGNELEFIAVLPEKVSLNSFITSDSFETNLEGLMNNMSPLSEGKLVISIPRFEYNYGIKLKDELQTLGIHEAFNSVTADFSNMSKRELYVGEALHKADIKFSEKGIKAAAVTVIMMYDKSSIEEPEKITRLNFNKPFMYVIRDKNTKEVWFTGTVYEPVLWEDVKSDYDYR